MRFVEYNICFSACLLICRVSSVIVQMVDLIRRNLLKSTSNSILKAKQITSASMMMFCSVSSSTV